MTRLTNLRMHWTISSIHQIRMSFDKPTVTNTHTSLICTVSSSFAVLSSAPFAVDVSRECARSIPMWWRRNCRGTACRGWMYRQLLTDLRSHQSQSLGWTLGPTEALTAPSELIPRGNYLWTLCVCVCLWGGAWIQLQVTVTLCLFAHVSSKILCYTLCLPSHLSWIWKMTNVFVTAYVEMAFQ